MMSVTSSTTSGSAVNSCSAPSIAIVRDRRALERRQQDAAQRVAERRAEAALERLADELAVGRRERSVDLERPRTDQVAPVRVSHERGLLGVGSIVVSWCRRFHRRCARLAACRSASDAAGHGLVARLLRVELDDELLADRQRERPRATACCVDRAPEVLLVELEPLRHAAAIDARRAPR